MQKQFILYGTSACHLCDDAEQMINSFTNARYTKKDIVEHDALLERYGLLIPVFRCIETGSELNWPFNASTLENFINGQ